MSTEQPKLSFKDFIDFVAPKIAGKEKFLNNNSIYVKLNTDWFRSVPIYTSFDVLKGDEPPFLVRYLQFFNQAFPEL